MNPFSWFFLGYVNVRKKKKHYEVVYWKLYFWMFSVWTIWKKKKLMAT